MSRPFEDSWVLVTGASSGLGEEFAKQLAHHGAKLVLTSRSHERLERMAQNLRQVTGVDVRVLAVDLSSDDGARKLCAAVDALGVEIRHVINNAGFGKVGPFAEFEPDSEGEMVRVNAEALWEGRRGDLFPADPRRAARADGDDLDLSVQLGAWITLEADVAASVTS